MIPCAILAIGAELLEGSVVDTNSAHISRELTAKGFSPQYVALVQDDKNAIIAAIRDACKNYALVLTTGGLGPTFDDLTAESVAEAFGVQTVLYKEVADHVERRLAKLNVPVRDAHLRQAVLPDGVRLFPNAHGTAYGFAVENGSCVCISMPGVPAEMYPMLREQVIPYLERKFNPEPIFKTDLRFGNVPESDVDDVIRNIGIPENVICIINASVGEVIVKIRDDRRSGGQEFADKIKNTLSKYYFGKDNETPAVVLGELLKKKRYTVSVAESCTGGLLGGAITAVSGSSEYFQGGVLSYDNSVKVNLLSVPAETIDRYGAVSEECAKSMAEGVKKLLKTDCAIAVTGIAGPSGGSEEKPVGTVYISVAMNGRSYTKRCLFSGGRGNVRERSVKAALMLMIMMLNENSQL